MNIELSEGEKRLLVRSLTRSIFDLEAAYKRNVNFNKDYADSVLERIRCYSAFYTRVSGAEFIFDSKSLQQLVYGQVNLELV